MDVWHKVLAGAAIALFVTGGALAYSYIGAREDRIRAEVKVQAEEETRKQYAASLKDLQEQEAKFHAEQAQAQTQLLTQFQQAQTPAQLSALFAKVIGSSQPPTINIPPATVANPTPAPLVELPAADLKQYTQQCEQCKLDLRTKTQDLSYADQQAQLRALDLAAVTKERDQWKTAAHGGTTWQRFKRGAKWFAIGGAIGGAAVAVAHH